MSNENLYNLGDRLGLNKKDIDDALKDGPVCVKYDSLSFGPGWYLPGTMYGVVSIKDF